MQPERGLAEPRVRRHEPVRLEQILRLRPDRGRHAAQLRPPVHRQFRQWRPRQCRRPANRSRSPGRIRTRSYDAANTGLNPASTSNSPTSSPARRCSRPRAPISFMSKQQFDSSTFAARPLRRDRQGELRRRHRQPRLCALRRAAGARAGSIRARASPATLDYKFLDRWSVDGSLVLDMSRHYYDTLGQTTPSLLSGRLFARARLQGRVHDADDQVFVQHQRSRPRISEYAGRSRHLQPGDAQPDV